MACGKLFGRRHHLFFYFFVIYRYMCMTQAVKLLRFSCCFLMFVVVVIAGHLHGQPIPGDASKLGVHTEWLSTCADRTGSDLFCHRVAPLVLWMYEYLCICTTIMMVKPCARLQARLSIHGIMAGLCEVIQCSRTSRPRGAGP